MFEVKKVVKKGDYLYAVCPDHPNRTVNNYVLMHRVVMENALGRLLTGSEVVHHKNHNKHDNRIENLEVMTKSNHAKHHAEDRPRSILNLNCPLCGKAFTRYSNQVSGRANVFCSRSCNAKFTRAKGKWQGKPIKKEKVSFA